MFIGDDLKLNKIKPDNDVRVENLTICEINKYF